MPWSRSTDLKTSLSMQSAEAEHARADVRHARELEQALHGAVLAERAVQDREDDVDIGERDSDLPCPAGARARIRAEPAASLTPALAPSAQRAGAVDLDPDDLVARLFERLDHARGGGERDRVLARAATEDDRDPAGRGSRVTAVGSRCRGRSWSRRRAVAGDRRQLADVDRHHFARLRVGARRGILARSRRRPGSGRSTSV